MPTDLRSTLRLDAHANALVSLFQESVREPGQVRSSRDLGSNRRRTPYEDKLKKK